MMDPISLTVEEACRSIGIGRTTLYTLLESKQLQFYKIGTRTLILRDSIAQFVRNQMESAR